MYLLCVFDLCVWVLSLNVNIEFVFQTSTAFSMEIFLSSRTLISIIRLAASDGVGIVVAVAAVVACNSCTGADNSFRVDDDDE